MWQTSQGDRTLCGAEAQLVQSAVTEIAEQLHDAEQFPSWGVHLFDTLSRTQKLATLDQVATYLLTETDEALELSAVNEATVGALFAHICVELERELASQAPAHWQSMVLNAILESGDPDFADEARQDNHRWDFADWHGAIESLADHILWDRDYEMASLFLDESPERAAFLKSSMGIEDDYFVNVATDEPSPPSDPRRADAE